MKILTIALGACAVLGLGHAELIEGGLKAPVVEQGYLHGCIRRQRLAQELIDPGLRRELRLIVADLDHLLADIGIGCGLDCPHAAVGREAGAASEKRGRPDEQGPAQRAAADR